MKQKITICFPAPLGRESKYISTRVECQCQSSDFMHGIIPLHFRLPSLLVWLKRHKCSRRPGGGFFQTLAVVAAATAKEARRSQCRNFPKLILPSPLLSSPLRSLARSPFPLSRRFYPVVSLTGSSKKVRALAPELFAPSRSINEAESFSVRKCILAFWCPALADDS